MKTVSVCGRAGSKAVLNSDGQADATQNVTVIIGKAIRSLNLLKTIFERLFVVIGKNFFFFG